MYGSLTITAVAFFMLFNPIPAHAGIFDWFFPASSVSASNTYQNPDNSQTAPLLKYAVNIDPNPVKTSVDTTIVNGEALVNETGPDGSLADINGFSGSDQISVYEVRPGNTLSSIAKMFGVSVNTIKWANDINGSIKPGDILTILPISGIQHKVVKGDTIASIAKKYKADKDEIIKYNDLAASTTLAIGTVILVPDAEPDSVQTTTSSGSSTVKPGSYLYNPVRGATGIPNYPGYYIRPISGGVKSQGLHGYNAVDLAAPVGTPIYAAADGKVIIAKVGGWNTGYGNYVVISHDNGTQTLYGHMNTVDVSVGQKVSQGDVIGTLGKTGKVTGPHVHFEVRGAVNPFK